MWTSASDAYSAGVVLFLMTYNELPYAYLNTGQSDWRSAFLHKKINLKESTDKTVAELLVGLLTYEPTKRMTVKDAIKLIDQFVKRGEYQPIKSQSFTNDAPIEIKDSEIIKEKVKKFKVLRALSQELRRDFGRIKI